MITTQEQFEESTSFELYVLERVCPAIEEHRGASIDLRGSNIGATVSFAFNESFSAAAIEQLKFELMPLLFGAAWKVFDLLLEFALDSAGECPDRDRWSIAEKQRRALAGQIGNGVVGCSTAVWAALLRVYASTVEHRHSLVHRIAKVDTDTGVLEGVDKSGQLLLPLSRAHQVALATMAGLVARSVLDGGMDSRCEDHLKYQLNCLTAHTGLPRFSAIGGVSAPAAILVTLKQENGEIVLDMSTVVERAREVFSTVSHFDLWVDVSDGSGRRLFARAEDCPAERFVIDIDHLPPWIAFR